MLHSLVGAIVGIKKPGFPFRRQCLLVYSKTMVLRRYDATLGSHLNARLVLAAMTVLQLEGIGAGSQRQQLMSEADPKDGNVFS